MPSYGNPDRLYSTGAAAAILGIPRRTLTKYCDEGKITAFQNKVSKRWSIKQADLVEFMKRYGLAPIHTSPGLKILIVDDDSDVVDLISKILLKPKWKISVDSALDGFEALMKIGKEMPDLIFLDIQMPGVNGKDILTAVKKGPVTKEIKTIVITGYPNEIEEMLALGADGALAKPFSIDQILEGVSKVLPEITFA